MRAAFLAAVLALAATGASGQSVYPGEDALALAGERYGRATPALAAAALERIFERLQVPAPRRERYAYVGSATLQKSRDYFETPQLSETVLVAAKSVRIGFARNVLVISGGDVDISHASGVVVIAAGSFRLSHESAALGPEPSGVYVVRGRAELGWGVSPIVYAAKGGKTGYSGPVTAYNTDVSVPSGVQVVTHNRGALFRGEPVRPATPPHMLVNSGESMPFSGERCKSQGEAIDLLDRMLPYVRREVDCPRIASAAVRCVSESGEGAGARAREAWTFELCGRVAEVRVDSAPNLRQINLASLSGAGAEALNRERAKRSYGSAAAQAPTPARELSAAQARHIESLFKDGSGHLLKGELMEARAKYQEAEASGNPHARGNLENVERQIRRADEAVAVQTAVIEAGRASARIYAERGLLRLRHNDVSRGLQDLERAVAMSNADPSLALERARGYLLANRPEHAGALATELIARHPRFAAAYEVRAWAGFMRNAPDEARKDALSSLAEAPAWTPESFAAQGAGSRVLIGYLALRQNGAHADAGDWLREWQPYLRAGAWPDALLLFLLGGSDERSMREAALGRRSFDGGAAEAEAFVVLALNEALGGGGSERRRELGEHFRKSYGAGRTVPWILYTRMHTPGQGLTPGGR